MPQTLPSVAMTAAAARSAFSPPKRVVTIIQTQYVFLFSPKFRHWEYNIA